MSRITATGKIPGYSGTRTFDVSTIDGLDGSTIVRICAPNVLGFNVEVTIPSREDSPIAGGSAAEPPGAIEKPRKKPKTRP